MTVEVVQASLRTVLKLAQRQHGVVSRRQLMAFGMTPHAIAHRLRRGRLHRIHAGVYAVGAPRLARKGEWMAAVLACGPGALLSHRSAGRLWRICSEIHPSLVEVSVPSTRNPRRPGIHIHRRAATTGADAQVLAGIPVTSLGATMIDLAAGLDQDELAAVVADADRRSLANPEQVRSELERFRAQPGAGRLRALLDRQTFALTESQLERRFLPIARRAGLAKPLTQARVCGFRVDFFWPGLGLVVETDGLRYHRTAERQAGDRRRDQAHTAAGLTALRFTHSQITFESHYVESILARTASRLRAVRES